MLLRGTKLTNAVVGCHNVKMILSITPQQQLSQSLSNIFIMSMDLSILCYQSTLEI
jgi:hypothetical protein